MTSSEQLSKPIRLSDGTEIFETVQMKQLYTVTGFAVHQRPYRRKNPQTDEEVQSIKEEEVNIGYSRRQFAGGKARSIDGQLRELSRNDYKSQKYPLFYDEDEIPFEKYGRLRMELHRFTQDLQDYSKESTNESEKRTVALLTQSLKELTKNLESFRSEAKYQSFFEKTFSYQLESLKTSSCRSLLIKLVSASSPFRRRRRRRRTASQMKVKASSKTTSYCNCIGRRSLRCRWGPSTINSSIMRKGSLSWKNYWDCR
ncbi:hypothetical protein RFI_13481 [Reticulomyxa filosa]|uniref:Uncharacterized protein n=1 Tax=Reticulomyxa filosa TaxID=46433 RepID=X6NBM1_RETFI|nr:hypothetical protein RFI_13481 [Reticulomyxa filosa]|eukprot:ETO23700.1 hypothetical protein RFI_13481 [Reticulomyxa filosa]